MKTAMLIESRKYNTGYLFLDPENAPADATVVDFTLAPGVLFCDVEDDDKVVWLVSETAIRVVPRVDFENGAFENECPIPSYTLCLTEADYQTLIQPRG